MEKKPRNLRKIILKSLLWAVCGLALLLIAATAGGIIYWNWYLPDYINDRLLPPVREQLGLDEMELRIRRIGLSGLDLETFTLTGADGRTLAIDSIRADYTPHLPFRTPRALDITNLTLAGGDIRASVKDGRLAISGFELDRVLERVAALSAPAPAPDDEAAREAAVVLEKITLRDIRLHLDLEGRLIVIPVKAVVTSENNEWKNIRADLTLTPRGQRIGALVEYDSVASTVKLTGGAKLQLEALSDLTGVKAGGSAALRYDLSAGFAGGDLNAVGTFDATLELGDRSGLPVVFRRPVELHQNLNLRYRTAARELHAILDGEMAPTAIAFDQEAIRAETGEKVRWKFVLSSTPADGLRFAEAGLSTGRVRFDAHGFTLNAPQLRFERLNDHYTITGSGMTVSNPELKLEAAGINLLIPLLPTEQLPATLNAGSIRMDKRELGALRSSFHIKGSGMRMKGDFENKLIPGARIDFRGEVMPRPGQMPDMLFEMNVPPWSPKSPVKLAEINPAFGDATANGIVSLGGAARFEAGKLTTGVQLLLENGSFQWPELKLDAENIRLDLRFNDLLGMNTPGGQSFRIGRLRCGDLDFGNATVLFDIASKEQANIERASVEWCGGTVMVHSIRLNPSSLDRFAVNTELYCENLSLAELVSQLGLSNASGDGALFGKIPVRFSSQRGLLIDSSYLYSRPGGSNTIKLADPEKIAGGMADAALRQSQLDFALEALRDFTYSWAKLNFTTEKENLVLSLQFDGRPNQPLPFAYDENSGQLRRDPAGKAVFEGIQLNINTRLPLNRLLQLNDKFKQFKKNKPEEKPKAAPAAAPKEAKK